MVAVGFLYLQPLTNRHFHFLIGVSTWYEFKNSVAIDIGFLRSQPLTNVDFCNLIIVESATSELLLELLTMNSRSFYLSSEMLHRMS